MFVKGPTYRLRIPKPEFANRAIGNLQLGSELQPDFWEGGEAEPDEVQKVWAFPSVGSDVAEKSLWSLGAWPPQGKFRKY